MKLILRDYISLLRESNELEDLLKDLLLSMGIAPFSVPQKGVRQNGVDLLAVGPDVDDEHTKKVFLFVLKAGNLDRRTWDAPNQGVRESLNEILDIYLLNDLQPSHKSKPKKIIVCCNGYLKQEAKQNWSGFTETHTQSGKIEFDLWGIDELSRLVEEHMLNERLLPPEFHNKLRKTLALIDLNEYTLEHYYELLEESLFGGKMPKSFKSSTSIKKSVKILRLIHLSLKIIHHWAVDGNNLKPALTSAERTILRVWDWISKNDLHSEKKIIEEFSKIFGTYLSIGQEYFSRIREHLHVRDGLSGYESDFIPYCLKTFEVIGILSVFGLSEVWIPLADDEESIDNLRSLMGDSLIGLINNNMSSFSPLYDEHSIDIGLGLLLLYYAEYKKDAAGWIASMIGRMCSAYRIGKYFPISSDSYDDLVENHTGEGLSKEELTYLSTLLPMLAEWSVILGREDIYEYLRKVIMNAFPHVTLEIWHPDEDTDESLYKECALRTSGSMQSDIKLPKTLQELKANMLKVQEHVEKPETLSCIKHGWPILGLIASRHFRTPIPPIYWQCLLHKPSMEPNG